MTSAQPLLDALFEKGMRHMTNRKLRDWAYKSSMDMEHIYCHTWQDEQGHRWSFLSRVGYFHAIRSPSRTSSTLLSLALLDFCERHQGDALAVQTQPGEPDVLWAWLGTLSYMVKDDDHRLNDLLQKALAHSPGVDAADASLGWVGQALALGHRFTSGAPTRPHMHAWVDALITKNLLNPCLIRATRMGKDVPFTNWSSWNDTGKWDYPTPPPPPQAQEDQVWKALLGWAADLVRKDPALSVKATFDAFNQIRKPSLDLGPEAMEALKDYVRAGALERPEQPVHGGAVNAAALVVALGGQFSPAEEGALVDRLMDRTFVRDPGEPDGSLYDWHGFRHVPVLATWIKAVQLESQLPIAAPAVRKPRF